MTAGEKRRLLAECRARHPDRPGAGVTGPHHDTQSELSYYVVLGDRGEAWAYYPDGNPNQAFHDLVDGIARRVLRLETLLPRGRDALDVHPRGVAAIREALLEAYEAGRSDGRTEAAAG